MSQSVVYFDLYGGASGDMLLGALLDLGLDVGGLNSVLRRLNLGLGVRTDRVTRSGLGALKATVLEDELPADGHDHPGHHGHEHRPHPRHHHHRSLPSITKLIREADLPGGVAEAAIAVFERLAVAEAHVHGSSIESVHFHEVGAADAIGDIVGFCACWEQLGRPALLFGPMPTGGGTVKAAHGELPVPAPATLRLMEGLHVWDPGVRHEMVTPTGAAILTALGRQVTAWPSLRVSAIGVGAGSRDTPRANILRAVLGAYVDDGQAPLGQREQVVLVETNIDDTTGQVVGAACETLLKAGALDVWWTSVGMKKGRPGVVLSLLCRSHEVSGLAEVMFRELPTLGLRYSAADRLTLQRKHVTVDTEHGRIRLKVRFAGERVFGSTPEYDDCLAAAREHGVPLREVQEAAVTAAARLGLELPG